MQLAPTWVYATKQIPAENAGTKADKKENLRRATCSPQVQIYSKKRCPDKRAKIFVEVSELKHFHFSFSTRIPKFGELSNRAIQTQLLLLCRALCFARAFFASILGDRQGACSGSHAHAKNSRLQIQLSFSLETQNLGGPLLGNFSASPRFHFA